MIDGPTVKMAQHANDNIRGRHIEPFHRLYAEGLLHRDFAVNAKLFYIGQRYAASHEKAGAIPVHSPASYDAYRDVPIAERRIDTSRPYYEAAQALDAIELRELVEAIVIHGRPVIEVGKEFTGRKHDQQARSSAITALGIGLMILREHYACRDQIAA